MTAPDPLAKLLNPPQLEAVRHGTGPLLILAGAGSGKTRVLTHRIAHLLRAGLARAPEILAVTFTNKAAGELRERVGHLVGPEAERLWVATFHAAGARILRREAEALGLTRSFTIYDDGDQLAACKRVCSDLGLDIGTAKQHLGRIDRWKNLGVLPAEVRVAEYDIPGKSASKVYARYQAALQASNAVDFGDLLLRVRELFEKHPEIASRYSGRFRHILVDEFQDTNPIQYQLLRMLSSDHGNLCVVGDDDQSIYRWRGAEVENILDFPRHFEGTKVIKLEQNYRSTGRILSAAHAVISKNPRRAEKTLWTAAGEGEKLRVVFAEDERDEGNRVASELYTENARGTSYAQMAVFYRANAQSRVLEDQLRGRRIPYRVVRGRSFYDRAEVKDVAAYLRLCVNPRSDGDLLRIVNTPPRGIGDTTVEALRRSATRQGLSLWEALETLEDDADVSASARSKLLPFRALMRGLQAAVQTDGTAAPAIERVLHDTGLADRLRLEGEEGEERLENVLELAGAARDFDASWAEARAETASAGEPGSAIDSASRPLDGLSDPRAAPPAPAPGGLGSPSDETEPPGDRPDRSAALAAAAPDLDPERGDGPDTPLLGFLEQLALVGDADAADGGDRVSLMTLHAAKGLEFDAVWMTGLEERVFPHARALGQSGPRGAGGSFGSAEEDPDELAEERRLCYVGMTRARKRLTLSLARCRALFGELRFNAPSRFLRELPPSLTEGLGSVPAAGGPGGRVEGSARDRDRNPGWDEFDQRPNYSDAPPRRPSGPPRPQAVPTYRPAAASPARVAPASGTGAGRGTTAGGLGPGARVRHASFGVGVVEESDGAGESLKLTVRFPPGVGLKKVLARFLQAV